MTRSGPIHAALIAPCLFLAACGGAETYSPPIAHEVTEAVSRTEESATATVQAIEPASRLVQLLTESGETVTIACGPEVRNFDRIEVGDVVQVVYQRAVAAALRPSTAELAQVTGTISAKPADERKPAAVAGMTIEEIVEFVSYDEKAQNVVFRSADGFVRTVRLFEPEMQELARSLVRGDKVEIAFAEGIAVELVPGE